LKVAFRLNLGNSGHIESFTTKLRETPKDFGTFFLIVPYIKIYGTIRKKVTIQNMNESEMGNPYLNLNLKNSISKRATSRR